MFSNTAVALYALVLAGVASAQSFTVATPPSVVQCQPAALSWSGGQAPYFPSIIPGSQPGAAALKEFPSQTGTSLVWNVDLAQGTSITIQIRDSTGGVQYSSAIIIQNSSDASCVNGSVSATASGGSSATATGGATSPAPTATTPAASSAASAGSSASTRATGAASGTSTAATPNNTNAASTITKSAFGVAGLAGLIGAALF